MRVVVSRQLRVTFFLRVGIRVGTYLDIIKHSRFDKLEGSSLCKAGQVGSVHCIVTTLKLCVASSSRYSKKKAQLTSTPALGCPPLIIPYPTANNNTSVPPLQRRKIFSERRGNEMKVTYEKGHPTIPAVKGLLRNLFTGAVDAWIPFILTVLWRGGTGGSQRKLPSSRSKEGGLPDPEGLSFFFVFAIWEGAADCQQGFSYSLAMYPCLDSGSTIQEG